MNGDCWLIKPAQSLNFGNETLHIIFSQIESAIFYISFLIFSRKHIIMLICERT